MNDLILCSECERHIRRDEGVCPFCGAAVSDQTRAVVPRRAPRGLSRAKLYAFNAAVVTGIAAAACGGDTGTETDAAVSDGASGDGQVGDGSGGDASGGDAMADVVADNVNPNDASDATVTDANDDADAFLPPPPYGCVFPDACADVKV
jgi:hypothetical protein